MLKLGALPAHPLIVHAPVVLVPLVAVGLAAFFFLPSWRRPLGVVLVALAAVSAGAAILAVASGEELGEALGRGAELDEHRSYGERARLFAVALAVATGALVLYDRRGRNPQRWLRHATAAVGIVGISATASVFVTGHSGAQLAWAEKVPDADSGTLAVGAGAAAAPTVTAATTPTSAHDHGTSPSTPATQPTIATESSTTTAATAASTTPAASPTEPEVHIVLGEWALVSSATQAPPGPTTFRFHNAGTVPHALRIRGDGDDNDDLEWRSATIGPGQEATLTADLPPGLYEIDCPKEDSHGEHDALGMETSFQVSDAAPPLTAPTTTATPAPPPPPADAPSTTSPSTTAAPAAAEAPAEQPTAPVTVAIQAFAFQPEATRIRVGDEVTWSNGDPTAHNATGNGWATATLPAGGSTAVRFDAPGTYDYRCTIHPSMRGTIIVE